MTVAGPIIISSFVRLTNFTLSAMSANSEMYANAYTNHFQLAHLTHCVALASVPRYREHARHAFGHCTEIKFMREKRLQYIRAFDKNHCTALHTVPTYILAHRIKFTRALIRGAQNDRTGLRGGLERAQRYHRMVSGATFWEIGKYESLARVSRSLSLYLSMTAEWGEKSANHKLSRTRCFKHTADPLQCASTKAKKNDRKKNPITRRKKKVLSHVCGSTHASNIPQTQSLFIIRFVLIWCVSFVPISRVRISNNSLRPSHASSAYYLNCFSTSWTTGK